MVAVFFFGLGWAGSWEIGGRAWAPEPVGSVLV